MRCDIRDKTIWTKLCQALSPFLSMKNPRQKSHVAACLSHLTLISLPTSLWKIYGWTLEVFINIKIFITMLAKYQNKIKCWQQSIGAIRISTAKTTSVAEKLVDYTRTRTRTCQLIGIKLDKPYFTSLNNKGLFFIFTVFSQMSQVITLSDYDKCAFWDYFSL